MPRTENLTRTPLDYKDRSRVNERSYGFIDIFTIKGNGLVPPVLARISHDDRQKGVLPQLDPEQGIYGLQCDDKHPVLSRELQGDASRSIGRAAREVRSKVSEESSPLIFTAKDGVGVYAPVGSPLEVIMLPKDQPGVNLTLEGEDPIKTFLPDSDTRVIITDSENAKHLLVDADAALDDMVETGVSYLEVTLGKQQANAMRAGDYKLKRQSRQASASADEPLEGVIVTPMITQTPAAAELYTGENIAANTSILTNTEVIDQVRQHQEVSQSAENEPSASSLARQRMIDAREQEEDSSLVQDRFIEGDRYKEARDAYDAADQQLARRVAARTKLGMFTFKKTREKLDREIEESAVAYDRMAKVFDGIQVEKWRSNGIVDAWKAKDPDLTDDEINERFTQKLANYHTAKQRLHNLRTHHEFRENKKFGKLSEWHDNASEWYAGLDKKSKIYVGLGVAAAGGLLTVAAGAAFGAVGAAGMVGAKVYKTYAQSRAGIYGRDAYVDTLKARETDASGDARVKTSYDLQQEAAARMAKLRSSKVEKTDKINKRARNATLASIALLGAGGAVSHVDTVRDITEGARAGVANWWNELMTPDAPQAVSGEIGNADGEWVDAPEVAPAPEPKAPEVPAYEFSADAGRVDAGEGWYQTFSEMGITSATEQANLLQKVGPELVARGWAYPMVDGTYGISRPGALPRDVLELIQKSR